MMTVIDSDRARLALAMGLIETIESPSTKGQAPYRIVYPNRCGQICNHPNEWLPDPWSDANACEALIDHLRAQGWHVEIQWQPSNDPNMAAGVWIHLWRADTEEHHRIDGDADHWKALLSATALQALPK